MDRGTSRWRPRSTRLPSTPRSSPRRWLHAALTLTPLARAALRSSLTCQTASHRRGEATEDDERMPRMRLSCQAGDLLGRAWP